MHYTSSLFHVGVSLLQNIVRLYNQDLHMAEKDAKINFLQLIYKWQTFGSAFFEVKVGYANFLLVHALSDSIQQLGLLLTQTTTSCLQECYKLGMRSQTWFDDRSMELVCQNLTLSSASLDLELMWKCALLHAAIDWTELSGGVANCYQQVRCQSHWSCIKGYINNNNNNNDNNNNNALLLAFCLALILLSM